MMSRVPWKALRTLIRPHYGGPVHQLTRPRTALVAALPLECLAVRLRGNMHWVPGPGFCRGYKATESEQVQLNRLMTTAKSVEEILELVERHHSQFNFINVATAVNRISKHAKADMRSGGGQQLVGEALY